MEHIQLHCGSYEKNAALCAVSHLEQLCKQHHVALECGNVRRGVAFEVLCTRVRSMPASFCCPQHEL